MQISNREKFLRQVLHQKDIGAIIIWIPLLFLQTSCASSFILQPDLARKALHFQPVKGAYSVDHQTIEVINQAGRKLKGLLFESSGDQGIVLVGGGNAMGLEHTAHYASFLLNNGFRVLVYSYQGFDENEGSSSLDSLVSDARAFQDFARTKFNDERVVLFGTSISGATSVCLAQSLSPSPAVVTEAMVDPKTIIYSNAKKHWPLFFIGYPLAWISALETPDTLDPTKCLSAAGTTSHPFPIFFVFNPNDQVAPDSTINALTNLYQGPKSTRISRCNLDSGCHMNLYCDKDSRAAIINFIKTALERKPL